MKIVSENGASRTIKLMIITNNKGKHDFIETSEQYRKACNYVSQYVFDNDFLMNQIKLSNEVYSEVRKIFGLKSQMAQSVCRTVVARYRTTRTQLRNKPWYFNNPEDSSHPTIVRRDLNWLTKPIYFKRPQLDLVRNRDYSFLQDGTVSINTLGGRIKCAIKTKGWDKYLDGSWTFGTAKLLELNGNWYLHISATKDIPQMDKASVAHVVGIDRGLRFLATTYDETGKTKFYSGEPIGKRRRRYQKVREELQRKHTKSSLRRIRKINNRENRYVSDVNHRITKALIDYYGENTIFVIEDLSGITKNTRNNYDLKSWAFHQFEQYLIYKARESNCMVVQVDAHYTSQRCIKCGVIAKDSRNHYTHIYKCKNCGYSTNDDRLGAMNIQQLGTEYVSGTAKPKITKLTTFAE